jgi:PadR family transcriptional regulator PadR
MPARGRRLLLLTTPAIQWESRPTRTTEPFETAITPERRSSGRTQAAAARKAAAEAKRAAEEGFEPAGRPSDVFGGDLPLRGAEAAGGPRRRDIFTVLVLHLIAKAESGSSYGNQLIEQIAKITGGAVTLNPNTIYPLLRELEGGGFIEGRWEHPEKRSRRLYTLTAQGRAEYERLRGGLAPFLDSIVQSITLIKKEIYG